jgi:Undecaprenyl-phosphate glucose phosphotransferase
MRIELEAVSFGKMPRPDSATSYAPPRRSARDDGAPAPGLRVSLQVATGLLRAIEAGIFMAAGAFAWGAAHLRWGADLLGTEYLGATCIASLGAILYLTRIGAYRVEAIEKPRAYLLRIAIGPLVGLSVLSIALFLLKSGNEYSRLWALLWAGSATAGLLAARALAAQAVAACQRVGISAPRIALVGATEDAEAVIKALQNAGSGHFRVEGVWDDRQARTGPIHAGIPILGTLGDLEERCRRGLIDTVVIALPLGAQRRIDDIVRRLGRSAVDLHLTTDVVGRRYAGYPLGTMAGLPLIAIAQRPLKDWDAVAKWGFDKIVGSLLLLLAAPLLAFVALAIKLDSRGPVLFRQKRLGFHDQIIEVWKLRTMHHDDADPLADRLTQRNDPRVTRVGKWLRRSSIDELPQLINVVRGEMSLVGPRPHPLHAKAADLPYAQVVADYARRHRVKPGITGWAQVNGFRGETRTAEQILQRVALDLHYIENWSLWLDIKILGLTMLREIRSRNAY